MPIVDLPEVGGHYVTLAEIRALPNLGDETKFPADDLAGAREAFETTFEEYCGMAFVPRTSTYRRQELGRASLLPHYRPLALPHYPVTAITAVRVYTTASEFEEITSDQLALILPSPTGVLVYAAGGFWPAAAAGFWPWPVWMAIEVDYVHGQAAPPADVKRAAKVAIQQQLLEDYSGTPTNRTYGTVKEGTFVRALLADGEKHPFGLAEVDAVAVRYRDRYRRVLVG